MYRSVPSPTSRPSTGGPPAAHRRNSGLTDESVCPTNVGQTLSSVNPLFLRWAAGGPPVDGLEVGLGTDRYSAGRGGGWPWVALLPRTGNHGPRVAHAVVDLGGAFPGDARFPGGPVIDAIDLLARDGGLLVLVDDHQVVVGQLVHLDEQRLHGPFLVDAQFGAGLEFLDFGPRIVRAECHQGGAKEKSEVPHGSIVLLRFTLCIDGSRGNPRRVRRRSAGDTAHPGRERH